MWRRMIKLAAAITMVTYANVSAPADVEISGDEASTTEMTPTNPANKTSAIMVGSFSHPLIVLDDVASFRLMLRP